MQVTFNEEEIQAVTKTARSSGAVGPKAKVPRLVKEITYDLKDWILDYGSGRRAMHTILLREMGYCNARAYDFIQGSNEDNLFVEDLYATKGKWDIIFASNVLNVQISEQMLDRTLNEVWYLMHPFSIFVANYPKSPRKTDLSIEDIHTKLHTGFRRVCTTHEDIFVCSRPIHVDEISSQVGKKETNALTRLAKLAFLREE